MPVTRIDHLVLTVADLERTIAWYGAVAGMRHVTFGDGRHALAFGEQKINLHVHGDEIEPYASRPTLGSADVCFIVDEDADALGARLTALGVAVELGPVTRDGATGSLTSYYLRDPDGNLVELSSPPVAVASIDREGSTDSACQRSMMAQRTGRPGGR